jgi:hypothetical protein
MQSLSRVSRTLKPGMQFFPKKMQTGFGGPNLTLLCHRVAETNEIFGPAMLLRPDILNRLENYRLQRIHTLVLELT